MFEYIPECDYTILHQQLCFIDRCFSISTAGYVVISFIIAFFLAFAVGANDVANSFGTTVGAKTISIKTACILATIFESFGAILLGANVGETIRKNIFDVYIFKEKRVVLMLGMVSAMIGSVLWQFCATFFKMPVSGTHAIVGALVGFALLSEASHTVHWDTLIKILISWILSPILSGMIAASFYYLMRVAILLKQDSQTRALIALPILYAVTMGVNLYAILTSAPTLGWTTMPSLFPIIASTIFALVTATLVQCAVVPLIEERIKNEIVVEDRQKHAVHRQNSFTTKEMLSGKTSLTMSPYQSVLKGGTREPSIIRSPSSLRSPSVRSNVRVSNIHSIQSSRTSREQSVSQTEEDHQKACRRATELYSTFSLRAPEFRPKVHSSHPELVDPPPRTPIAQESSKLGRRHRTRSSSDIYQDSHKDHLGHHGTDRTSELIDLIQGHKHVRIPEVLRMQRDIMRDTHVHDGNHGHDVDLEIIVHNGEITHIRPKQDHDHCAHDILRSVSFTSVIEEEMEETEPSKEKRLKMIHFAEVLEREDEMENSRSNRIVFSFLQILTACFGAFTHGGNDVSNAIGPLIAIWLIWTEGQVSQTGYTPTIILAFGGFGISLGLLCWGRRVIKTMGEDLTTLTASRGFCIDLASAFTVLAASAMGLPVSTTHCKVGAVVSVGMVRNRRAVDWRIFRNIVLAWFVTVPLAGFMGGATFAVLKILLIDHGSLAPDANCDGPNFNYTIA